MFAFARGFRVGIDVELVRDLKNADQIVARFFSAEEAAAYAALPPAARRQGFFSGWARKEAFVKALGRGLGQSLAAFTVTLAPADAAQYLTDLRLGTKIDLLTLDEFLTVDGVTSENILQFENDLVQQDQFDTATQTGNVTFSYHKVVVTEGIPVNGGGNSMPEPSSAALLLFGLLGLAGFSGKKFRSSFRRS